MTAEDTGRRLEEAAIAAHEAEACGDFAAANEAWRRYRLIGDTLRDPDDLLAEGVAISETARAIAG
jgi:negative regulator of sigma E activity